jgi:hypothetical protein
VGTYNAQMHISPGKEKRAIALAKALNTAGSPENKLQTTAMSKVGVDSSVWSVGKMPSVPHDIYTITGTLTGKDPRQSAIDFKTQADPDCVQLKTLLDTVLAVAVDDQGCLLPIM